MTSLQNKKGPAKTKNSEKPLPREKSWTRIYLLLLILIPFALYIRVTNFQFSKLDDTDIIFAHYDVLSSLKNIDQAFTHDAYMESTKSAFYRPMQTVSFMVDSQISGREPWGYHLSSLLLHILTVIALFFFLKKLGIKEEISFLLCLLFSVHPMFANTVSWIPARGDLLLGIFSLLSFITFINYHNNHKKHWIIFHTCFFLLALFSKESAVFLPVLFLVYFYFASGRKIVLKNVIPFLSIWVISEIIYNYARNNVLKVNLPPKLFGVIPFTKNLPAIPIIFGKLFIPYNLNTIPVYDNISIIMGAIILIGFIFITFKSMSRNNWKVILGALWFMLFIIPPMLFRSNLADFGMDYFEFRAYLPSIGILMIIGIMLEPLSKRHSSFNLLYIGMPTVFILAIIAYNHSSDYYDWKTFLNTAIKISPNNAVAFNERGVEYLVGGNNDKALEDFKSAVNICPLYSSPYYNEGIIYHNTNDSINAESAFSNAIRYDSLWNSKSSFGYKAIYHLAEEKIILNKYDEAIILLKIVDSRFKAGADVYNTFGSVYYAAAKYDSAIYYYSKAIDIDLNDGEAYYLRGNAYSKKNKSIEAEYNWSEAKKLGFISKGN